MIKSLATLGFAFALTGCAATYTLGTKKFDNEKAFQAAVEDERNQALSQVQTLPAPLTKKKLIAALPSEQTLYTENSRRHNVATGKPLTGIGIEQNTNLSKFSYKMTKVFFEGVQKRGIYSSVEIRDAMSMAVSIEPAQVYDVLYFTEPAIGSGQYFYSSVKHGKQVFAYDRSGEGVIAKVNAFIEAAQVQAIKD